MDRLRNIDGWWSSESVTPQAYNCIFLWLTYYLPSFLGILHNPILDESTHLIFLLHIHIVWLLRRGVFTTPREFFYVWGAWWFPKFPTQKDSNNVNFASYIIILNNYGWRSSLQFLHATFLIYISYPSIFSKIPQSHIWR